MENKKIDIQVLLELVLNQRVEGEIETALPKVLDLYLRKLNCLGAAILQSGHISFIAPKALQKSQNILADINTFTAQFSNLTKEPQHQEINKYHYHGFALADFGWLILIRNKGLNNELIGELSRVTYQLGRALCQNKEEHRLKLLQQLFDKSSDAIQIADHLGQLYYINEVASKRLGIDKENVTQYRVSDFELTFKNQPNGWKQHLDNLKEKQSIVITGENVNLKTGTTISVEVTASIITIKDKDFVVAISRDVTKRKEQEQKLKETTQKLESIFNEMSDVVWSVSVPEYTMLFVTPSVNSLYEISVAQWMEDSQWWQKAIHPEDAGVIATIFESLNTEGHYNVKYRIITPSGIVKWVRNKGKYIFDEQNNPIRIDGAVMDRTLQYQAQENLDQEIRLQEALIDIASTYINLDPKDVVNTIHSSLEKMGMFVSADRAYIFDYDFASGTTSNTYEWCNEGIPAEIDNLQNVPVEYIPQWLESHQKNEAFYVPDVQDLEDDGEGGLRSILEPQGIKSLIAIPMLDGKELIGFVGFDSVVQHYAYSIKEQRLLFLFGQMLINIRNRQKWDNQLRLQEEKYRNIITNMNLGLLEVDLKDVIVYANQSFCNMSGFSLKELKGRRAAELFVKDDYKNIISEKSDKRKESISDSYEIEVKDKQGNPLWWFISGAPNYDDKGQLIGSIGIHLDITKQKRLEQELAKAKTFAESAAKAKELFLANMSHEIRTPLNVIIGVIRQLTKENLNPDQQYYVKQSESSAKHLLTILNNVLDIAKIESGDMEIERRPFSLSALAYNVHSIMFSQAEEKGLVFKVNVSPEIKPVLLGDETRLRQVLINLLGNAIKFTETGSIHLSVELIKTFDNSQSILFEVYDTGIGMSEEFISKIFDKFSQEQNTSNRKYEGTGLGMAISNDLIKLMGGTMTVESKKLEGTSCKFVLQLPIGNPDHLTSKSHQIKPQAFKGLKALLVEDNEMNRFIAMQSLDYMGFETTEAENGKVATERIQNDLFDLVLMDIQMPVMDGVEATVFIREQLKINTPIIALTANAFKHDIDLYLSKGMNDFITKPYDEEDFFRKIDHVLNLFKTNKSTDEGLIEGALPLKLPVPIYDLSLLESMSRGNQEFVSKMINIFITLTREHSELMRLALAENNIETIKRTAHKIKPSIDQMGIVSLKDIVRKLEKFDPDTGSRQELESLIQQLTTTLCSVADSMEKEFVIFPKK